VRDGEGESYTGAKKAHLADVEDAIADSDEEDDDGSDGGSTVVAVSLRASNLKCATSIYFWSMSNHNQPIIP
jgi:hypothetical protein